MNVFDLYVFGLRPFGLRAFGLQVGTDVVAVLVVRVLTEHVPVFGGDLTALGGLLDRQRDPPAFEIDVDDLDPQLLTGCDHLVRLLDVVHRHLGDVNETFDAVTDLHERAERYELGDASVDELSNVV